jgi:hypothetical protein
LQLTVDTVQVYNSNTLIFTKYPKYKQYNNILSYIKLRMELLR